MVWKKKLDIFGVGVTLIAQTQLNKAWSKARGSLTREWTDFVATEEISLHIVTANGSVYANIWWSIPSNWIRITSARIESVEQNKSLLTTFVVVSSSSFSAGQIIYMLCVPGKKFLKINGNVSKIFDAKNRIHFLPQNTFPQTPNLIAPMPFSRGIKNTSFK